MHPRTRPVPPEIRDRVRELIRDIGTRRAAQKLGLSRVALLALAAGDGAMAGTLALAREALAPKAA